MINVRILRAEMAPKNEERIKKELRKTKKKETLVFVVLFFLGFERRL
jgi:hypothetical protein